MDCHKKIKEKHYGLKSLIQNGFSNKKPLLQLKATIEFMGNNKIAHYSWAEKKKNSRVGNSKYFLSCCILH